MVALVAVASGPVLCEMIGEPIKRLAQLIGEPIKLTGKRALRKALPSGASSKPPTSRLRAAFPLASPRLLVDASPDCDPLVRAERAAHGMVSIGHTLWLVGGYGNEKSYVPDVWCLALGEAGGRAPQGAARNR